MRDGRHYYFFVRTKESFNEEIKNTEHRSSNAHASTYKSSEHENKHKQLKCYNRGECGRNLSCDCPDLLFGVNESVKVGSHIKRFLTHQLKFLKIINM